MPELFGACARGPEGDERGASSRGLGPHGGGDKVAMEEMHLTYASPRVGSSTTVNTMAKLNRVPLQSIAKLFDRYRKGSIEPPLKRSRDLVFAGLPSDDERFK